MLTLQLENTETNELEVLNRKNLIVQELYNKMFKISNNILIKPEVEKARQLYRQLINENKNYNFTIDNEDEIESFSLCIKLEKETYFCIFCNSCEEKDQTNNYKTWIKTKSNEIRRDTNYYGVKRFNTVDQIHEEIARVTGKIR